MNALLLNRLVANVTRADLVLSQTNLLSDPFNEGAIVT